MSTSHITVALESGLSDEDVKGLHGAIGRLRGVVGVSSWDYESPEVFVARTRLLGEVRKVLVSALNILK